MVRLGLRQWTAPPFHTGVRVGVTAKIKVRVKPMDSTAFPHWGSNAALLRGAEARGAKAEDQQTRARMQGW
jgi:hypothetical protein